MKVGISNRLIVTKESSLGGRDEVELEDGEERAGDNGEDDAADHVATSRPHPLHRHGAEA